MSTCQRGWQLVKDVDEVLCPCWSWSGWPLTQLYHVTLPSSHPPSPLHLNSALFLVTKHRFVAYRSTLCGSLRHSPLGQFREAVHYYFADFVSKSPSGNQLNTWVNSACLFWASSSEYQSNDNEYWIPIIEYSVPNTSKRWPNTKEHRQLTPKREELSVRVVTWSGYQVLRTKS